jgi:hypothetical protein
MMRISDVLGQPFRLKLDACFDRYWTPIPVIATTDIQWLRLPNFRPANYL